MTVSRRSGARALGTPITVELLIVVPTLLLGVAALWPSTWLFASMTGTPQPALLAGYAVASLATLTRPFEVALRALDASVRRPHPAEQDRLETALNEVCARAERVFPGRVPTRRWLFAVQRSEGLNAYTSGRHLIVVTEAALALSADELEAVLAHEFFHQMAGDTVAKALRWWFVLPVSVLTGVARALAAVLAAASVWVSALIVPALLLCLVVWLPVLPLAVLMPLHAALDRRNEYGADAAAAAAGYGPTLLGLLSGVGDDHRSHWWGELTRTHPRTSERILRLWVLLQGGRG